MLILALISAVVLLVWMGFFMMGSLPLLILISKDPNATAQKERELLTTNQGARVSDNHNSLKAGVRGPTLLVFLRHYGCVHCSRMVDAIGLKLK